MTWLTVGTGFGPADAERDYLQFLRNLNVVAPVIEHCVDVQGWEQKGRPMTLNIVFRQKADTPEPVIERLAGGGDEWTFVASHSWLSPAYLDTNRGPWRLLAMLALCLATISEEGQILLPEVAYGKGVPPLG